MNEEWCIVFARDTFFRKCCKCLFRHFHYTTHGIEVSFFYAKSRTCSFIDAISKHLILKFINRRWQRKHGHCPYFKTSYVEVYRAKDILTGAVEKFQNILCWSLSLLLASRTALKGYFKTSYVEVYHQWREKICGTLEFQNILCWSLSPSGADFWPEVLHFKTSYVEVYLLLTLILVIDFAHFKTSYVEVYRNISSIHGGLWIFQNILCWSLS